MLQRGFMGIFDIKTDRVALATSSGTNAASIGGNLGPRKNLLERFLSVVCDVRPGEGLGALILTTNLFTLLGAYYLLKTVRESLILAEGGAEVIYRDRSVFDLGAHRRLDEQLQFRSHEQGSTPFLALSAHHPLYSNGIHRDNPMRIAQWDSLLRRHKVDLYLSGHDHDLQHLEFKGHPTSFVISGGGGAELVGWTTSPGERGPWGLRALGFTDLQISQEELVVRHIGKDATVLYEFKKSLDRTRRI